MERLCAQFRRFVEEESAPTSAEYALLLAFTALVVLAAAVALGGSLRDLFQATAPAIGNSSPPPP
jgi:Flp pilus assembly pilin Flp